ncbi:carbon-nitrogen hydrolase family protein [Pseudomonas protegens]|uniref:carbon-nitrogen hydrolase family protein n=1 Tax=Pseudomonas protegens TaxID=380021 RepID=UPI0004423FB4|nr:carbon-nitrogen hydrolase family protein [Pseudomonas protegens]MBP5106324.1 carbon-nitrogen hydrolase family protein [Pseudomonas protegens]MBP5125130.1 carbon-nitrogen hydrolase family protein [Pseudomonas protegens]MBP5127432.1 carbon-nitrogen hydrolase family protein [Pseudomonas protegens]MBP5148704.1 carbon-nitrogen hydrolase family protein [Pseudomonas protegens]BAO62902.1 carbon-nitrogen family hydrolase [Pseudomonas protegens Cab57]
MISKCEKTVAIVQMPAALLDRAESMRLAAEHIKSAALKEAQLVVFPETWLSCYPAWIFGMAGWDDAQAKFWYAKLLADSPVIGQPDDMDDDLAVLREAARVNTVTVVMGMNERSRRHGGSLYNSLVTIGPEGTILNVHRKLTPTHTERTVWANGDAAGLRVVDTAVGRVGGLVCWEHWHPLARQALHAQDEQIHVAAWPDMTEMHHVAARSYAFEGRCFVLCAGQYLNVADVPAELLTAYRLGVGGNGLEERLLFNGGSGVIAPDGSWVTAPLFGEPGIVLATIDLAQIDAQHHDLDVAGHYLRPDVFELLIDRRVRTGLTLRDD